MCIGRNSNLDKCKYGQMLDSNKQNGKYYKTKWWIVLHKIQKYLNIKLSTTSGHMYVHFR